MYLTYNNSKIEVPKPLALFLQGFQEGGLITTIGLFYGDRINSSYYMIVFHFIFYTIFKMSKFIKIVYERHVNF